MYSTKPDCTPLLTLFSLSFTFSFSFSTVHDHFHSIWGHWEQSEGGGATMVYDDGTACGSGQRRSVSVHLICAEEVSLGDVTEPETCVYELSLYLPQACSGGSHDSDGDSGSESDPNDESLPGAAASVDSESTAGNDANTNVVKSAPELDVPAYLSSESEQPAGPGAPIDFARRITELEQTVAARDSEIETMKACINVMLQLTADPSALDSLDVSSCHGYV
jgi:Glucosidase II beta subunit-like protein